MTQQDEIAQYVRQTLADGHDRDGIAAALTLAGWPERDVERALDGWVVAAAGMPPVPRPRPYVSAREGLVYGLLFLLLGCICWHITMLGFHLIEALLPDPGDFYTPPRSSIRWSVATLLPTMPLFLWLNARVLRHTHDDPAQRRSLVRKWFAAITLLVAALTLLGDTVASVYALLNGDLTLRFIAKAMVVAVLGVLVFAYYRDEMDVG